MSTIKRTMVALTLLSVAGSVMATEMEGRNQAAERLMMEAQARAYSYGLRCECTPKDFLNRVSPAQEGAKTTDYSRDEALRRQAEKFALGKAAV